MTLTKLDLETLLADDIDHVDGSGALDALRYINNAGVMLCNMYGWRWLDRVGTAISLVASQAYVDLPSDLLRIHSIDSDELGKGLVLVDFETFAEHEKQLSQPSGYYAYLGAGVGSLGEYTKRLFLYPTPSSGTTEKLNLKYKAGWNRFLTADGNTREATIPDFIEPLYLEVFRAYYMGYEEDGDAGVTQRMELVKNGQAYKDAVASDINMVPYFTPIQGSTGHSYEPNHIYNDLPT